MTLADTWTLFWRIVVISMLAMIGIALITKHSITVGGLNVTDALDKAFTAKA